MSEDLVVLREILQRELETINAYEKMLERVSDPALREIIDHVTDEEREHVAEMYHLIMDRDPKQRERSALSHAQLTSMSLLGTASATVSAAGSERDAAAAAALSGQLIAPTSAAIERDPVPPPPPVFPDGAWSVGALKRSPK